MQTTFFIKTLGCKTNRTESLIMAQCLCENGYQAVGDYKKADIYILNSCSVTSHADKQADFLLRQVKRANSKAKIILAGCIAQTPDKHVGFHYELADLILGNSEKLQIANYIPKLFSQNKKNFLVQDIMKVQKFNSAFLKHSCDTRPSVKIQEGCNNRCAYCIIPYARGNSRSESAENIIEQINYLATRAHKEVVLTGIHLGQWENDNKNFLQLLKAVENSQIHRFRLGSLYINEINEELIDFLKNSKKFCPHFHLSLQSVCDKTLKNMNRSYSAKEVVNIVAKLKTAFKNPFLGCDIIAGFPAENEKDFIITYENLSMCKLSKIHAFPYSKREGTPAAKMNGQTDENTKKLRVKKLLELSENLHKEFLSQNKNSLQEVLYEKKNLKLNAYSGITRNYIKVYKKSSSNLRNTIEIVNLSDFESLY